MAWTELNFGKHSGKTLPQVIFIDVDWFFHSIDENYWRTRKEYINEVKELFNKVRKIRIPQTEGTERKEAEYSIHPSYNTFSNMEIVPITKPPHQGSTMTFRKNVIDLMVPRTISQYDKSGNKRMIKILKHYVFGDENIRLTKAKCESFFDNPDNFDMESDK